MAESTGIDAQLRYVDALRRELDSTRHPLRRFVSRLRPLREFFRAIALLRGSGLRLRVLGGPSLLQQFLRQTVVTLKHCRIAREYYLYRYDRLPRASAAGIYLEQATFAHGLLRWYEQRGIEPFWRKTLFNEFCMANGFPTIPIQAVFRLGAGELPGETREKRSLVSKPDDGCCGRGLERWEYVDGTYRNHDRNYTHAELQAELRARSVDTTVVLQPAIRNHHDLQAITNGSLSTVRLTTSVCPDGTVALPMPTCRMPVGESPADNFQQGNMVAAVDPDTGVLDRAFSCDTHVLHEVTHHPDTDELIRGTRIPCWQEALDLCEAAQRACDMASSVGWDVAVTAGGPVLVEGNRVFGVEAAQCAHGAPLGSTCLPGNVLRQLSSGSDPANIPAFDSP